RAASGERSDAVGVVDPTVRTRIVDPVVAEHLRLSLCRSRDVDRVAETPEIAVHHSEFLDEGIPPSVCLDPKLIPLSVGDRWRRDRRFKTGVVECDIVAIEQYQHVGRAMEEGSVKLDVRDRVRSRTYQNASGKITEAVCVVALNGDAAAIGKTPRIIRRIFV